MIISASKAREKLFPLIEQVNLDHDSVTITSNNGNAVLVSESEWESMLETAFLLRTAANRKRLEKSLAELEAGKGMTVRYKKGTVLEQILELTTPAGTISKKSTKKRPSSKSRA
jgi:antitoxin YefM